MTLPTLSNLTTASGPASGGAFVRLTGAGFAPRVAVLFGDLPATVLAVFADADLAVVDVRTPTHEPGLVAVTLQNLGPGGAPVPGEAATLPGAYRFLRPPLVVESDLVRLVRALLRALKREVLSNVSMTVALDYHDGADAGAFEAVPVTKLPALVVTGPRLQSSPFYGENVAVERAAVGPKGPELERLRPPYTADLLFTLTGASDRLAEVLNLMDAVVSFRNRTRWLAMARDPARPEAGEVRYELEPEGEVRPSLDGKDDVRAFVAGLRVRGFRFDEGMSLDRGRAVATASLEVGGEGGGPAPGGDP
jgi:IPT/TIG domain